MSWPGQRWTPGDLGVTGNLFSRSTGSGGSETLERILESRRNRRPGGSGEDGGGGGGAGLMGTGGGPSVPLSRPSPPPSVTATATGPTTIVLETGGHGVEHVGVEIDHDPPIWVPVVDGTGATQLVLVAGDVVTAVGATTIELI